MAPAAPPPAGPPPEAPPPAALPAAVRAFLDERVARGPSVLALDYDGTLAPFRVERMEAVPAPAVGALLRELAAVAATRVVIVSGRPVAELEQLLPLSPLPELWGVHGWERRYPDGRFEAFPLRDEQAAALAAECARLAARGAGPQLDRKSTGIALHWRGLPPEQAAALAALAAEAWPALGAAHGFHARAFDGGIELRAPGRDKGSVVRELQGRGGALAYVGDDETDEDAFRALPEDGLGVRVRLSERPTAATVEISPEQLPALLAGWREAARRAPAGQP